MNQPIASESALSAFLHNLPDTLRQPFSLAVIGSVGAHLFFFLWLPLFTTEEVKPDNQRVVRLLNSSNSPSQSQVATSQLGLPPIPKTPNSTVKIPLGQLTPPIPPDSSLYKFQDPIGPFTSPIVPPAPPVIRFPQSTSFFLPPPLPPNFNRVPDQTSTARPAPVRNSPAQNLITTPLPPSNGQTDQNIPRLTPEVTVNSPTQPSTQPSDPATPQNQPAAPTATVRERLLAENRLLQNKLTFKSPGATQNEVDSNNIASYGSWLKTNVTDRGIAEGSLYLEKPILIADVPYNLPFNLAEKPEPAYIHILVASDGTVVTRNPTITGRTGYGILDDLALREVVERVTIAQKEGTLKPTGDNKDKYVIYTYKVTFKIDRAA